jgi:hypothetical protein
MSTPEISMYFLSATKKLFAAGALVSALASSSIVTAETPQANSSDKSTTHSQGADQPSLEALPGEDSIEQNTQACPDTFYQLKLPRNGKLCQVFAADLPASMIFFVPDAPSYVIEYFTQDSATFSINKQIKGRYMMQSSDKNTTLIISSDGEGTQVDVLVKTDNS